VALITPTRILVVGGGAREHALAWKLSGEPGINEVLVAPGRQAMARGHIRTIELNLSDARAVVDLARSHATELAVIGPEQPLADGLADALLEAGVPTFGPSAAAARIETSKSFCREVAGAAGVPMAEGRAFDGEDRGAAIGYAESLARRGRGVVVKADGLAAGKGVTVCDDAGEAEAAIERIDGQFVVEQRLQGREASVIAVCDGRDAVALPISRDHKRILDGDRGPNTGGMGAYSPLPDLPDEAADEILDRFHLPVLRELARRGSHFRGALYAGLMLAPDGPRLLEFNARFGDPETQVILPRIAVALGPLLLAAARGSLPAGSGPRRLPVISGATVGIVLAAAGYPDQPRAGDAISGLDASGQMAEEPNALVFHGATARAGDGYVTQGGRVLTVVGRGADLAAATAAAERAADGIAWPGMQRRHDIGVAPVAAGGVR
jgi:phosphoribosylamine--glycine ligase